MKAASIRVNDGSARYSRASWWRVSLTKVWKFTPSSVTYTGGTTINNGAININNGAALGRALMR
jgi:hypothetical protein